MVRKIDEWHHGHWNRNEVSEGPDTDGENNLNDAQRQDCFPQNDQLEPNGS